MQGVEMAGLRVQNPGKNLLGFVKSLVLKMRDALSKHCLYVKLAGHLQALASGPMRPGGTAFVRNADRNDMRRTSATLSGGAEDRNATDPTAA
jgi:hypothetical protein